MQKQRLNIGSVVSRSFVVVQSNPTVFLGLMALCCVPWWFVDFLAGENYVVGLSLYTVLGVVTQSFFTYAVFQTLVEREVSIKESLRHGTARFFPLTAIAFLVTMWVLIVVVVAVMMASIVHVAFLIFILAAAFFLCIWVAAVPACVLEKLGPLAAIKRSMELTKGHRLILSLFLVLIFVSAGFLQIAFEFVLTMFLSEGAADFVLLPVEFILLTLIDIMAAIVYCDLRTMKEGLLTENVAEVFE